KRAGIKRYVMISSFDTTREAIQEAPESFAPYVVAKHYADEWLRATDLDYTIIHPGALTNDEPTGNVELAETVGRNDVPRADIAKVILATLQNDSTIGKAFQIVKGTEAIEEAIENITLGVSDGYFKTTMVWKYAWGYISCSFRWISTYTGCFSVCSYRRCCYE